MSETAANAPSTPDPSEEERYATLLEEAFIAERGTPFLLSPKDWMLIRGFLGKGIPADTAIRAIRETFAKRRTRGMTGKISSIAYCADAIEERWELERRGLVGSHDASPPPPPEATGPLLASLLDALETALPPGEADAAVFRSAVEKAAGKVRAIPPGASFEEIEETLLKIETSMLKGVRKSLLEEPAAEVARRVEAGLGAPGDLPEAVRERTRRALERREVRRAAGLPPLTLLVP